MDMATAACRPPPRWLALSAVGQVGAAGSTTMTRWSLPATAGPHPDFDDQHTSMKNHFDAQRDASA